MESIWFGLIAFLLAGYVLLDGFDLGAGIIHLAAARSPAERRQLLASVGPVWDGNEVWLLAAGGTMYFAFPMLYASAFAGFYLPLMIVLWLLILRGIGIEFQHQLEGPIWGPLLDAAFAGSSLLLAICFGAALGNVVRGVPLDGSGEFFLPLWTNFLPSSQPPGVLDWFTILCGLHVALALAIHGTAWVGWKTEGAVSDRAGALGRRLWLALVVSTGILTAAAFTVQPLLGPALAARPWAWVFPALAAGGLFGMKAAEKGPGSRKFAASCSYLAGMLASVAASLYPTLLPTSSADPATALTITNSAASEYGLRIGLVWWLPAMALTLGYVYFLYSRFTTPIPAPEDQGVG